MKKKSSAKKKAGSKFPVWPGGARKPVGAGKRRGVSHSEVSKLADNPPYKGFHRSKKRPHSLYSRNGSGVYVGRPRRDGNIDLKRLGGVGHALGLKDIEKYVKPVMLIATGAVGAAFADGMFIKGFVEGTLNVGKKWSSTVRMCIALAMGFAVARFTKAEEAKLLAIGLSGQQVLQFVRELAEGTKFAFPLNGVSVAPGRGSSMLGGAKRVGGVSRAFSLGGVRMANPASSIPSRFGGAVMSGAASAASGAASGKGEFGRMFPV